MQVHYVKKYAGWPVVEESVCGAWEILHGVCVQRLQSIKKLGLGWVHISNTQHTGRMPRSLVTLFASTSPMLTQNSNIAVQNRTKASKSRQRKHIEHENRSISDIWSWNIFLLARTRRHHQTTKCSRRYRTAVLESWCGLPSRHFNKAWKPKESPCSALRRARSPI